MRFIVSLAAWEDLLSTVQVGVPENCCYVCLYVGLKSSDHCFLL